MFFSHLSNKNRNHPPASTITQILCFPVLLEDDVSTRFSFQYALHQLQIIKYVNMQVVNKSDLFILY